ncbi:MAG: TIGR03960 family B12-binding radical SAM protein [Defluviitaleaceae bacterium]|nr:TIGR03960 family B12-binding radical SAM protein [Defluviitaleaceae bacterium]
MLSDDILINIEKPSRYLGGEYNMVKKDVEGKIRFLFSYPDIYEVGMSNIGLNIIYYFLNRREDVYCERVFAPWHDIEEILKKEKTSLFSLETYTPLREFDFFGFTLQYEMSYTNIINMLDMSGIPVFSNERGEDDPILIAGGPCVYNPEPLADIFDVFYIGEGEVMLDIIMDIYKENKNNSGTKLQFLEKILVLDGVYIPTFYEVAYKEDGTIKQFRSTHKDAPETIKKVFASNLDAIFVPEKQLVPLIETEHYRAVIELFRGCIRGCRFCQAGFTYRPVREKSKEKLLEQSKILLEATGHEEISLSSLSTSDYTQLLDLADVLAVDFKDINIALPSLRIDGVTTDIVQKLSRKKRSSITFAPEAGSQRLRDAINKDITEEEIIEGASLSFKNGYSKLKLYFMIGLPSETEEDVLAIKDLSEKLVGLYFQTEVQKRTQPRITISTSCFVPKPFTPYQWEPQNLYEEFMNKQKVLKQSIAKKQINYKYHDAKTSSIEAVISRGDRRIGKAIVIASRLGAKFDAWNDHFNYEIWQEAFKQAEINPFFYANRKRELDEILPWDHINIGITKEFLARELEKSKKEQITENCRKKCSACGINKNYKKNYEKKELTVKCL